ncbi:hypothetical protein ACT8ZV_15675 [Nocardioides sp. MAHUQ-72]
MTALLLLAEARPWGVAFGLLAVAGVALLAGLVALTTGRRR